MKEKVLLNNKNYFPFFGDRMTFINGLDPLALQNTSIATFTELLPGLNNVTGRIRYYSFYCWVLKMYAEQKASTYPEIQKKFIRRAEYLISLISQFYPNLNRAIPGSNYAHREIIIEGKGTHNLQEATFKPDGKTEGTYWKYSFGAFGQYYVGSMSEMNLIEHFSDEIQTYILTESENELFVSGLQLANAFDANLSTVLKKNFLETVERGTVDNSTLKKFVKDFDLTKVPESEEQVLLAKMLIQKDAPLQFEEDPSVFRKNTTKLLLELIIDSKELVKDRTFVNHAYEVKGRIKDEKNSTLFGWYYYQFNEYWQIANTAILNGILANLHDNSGVQWDLLTHLISYTTDEILEILIESELIKDGNKTVSELLNSFNLHEANLLEINSKNTGSNKIAFAILAIFAVYKHNFEQLSTLQEFSQSIGINKDGEPCDYFLNEFAAKKEMKIVDFVKDYLFKKIILRHQFVALRKMRSGNISTQKFILEDFKIRYLGNFDEASTGPRLYNLLGFLEDLSIVDGNQNITDFGKEILNGLQS